MQDNITEHPNTINILARFNIYQEVFLAALYKSLPFVQVSFYYRLDFVWLENLLNIDFDKILCLIIYSIRLVGIVVYYIIYFLLSIRTRYLF